MAVEMEQRASRPFAMCAIEVPSYESFTLTMQDKQQTDSRSTQQRKKKVQQNIYGSLIHVILIIDKIIVFYLLKFFRKSLTLTFRDVFLNKVINALQYLEHIYLVMILS